MKLTAPRSAEALICLGCVWPAEWTHAAVVGWAVLRTELATAPSAECRRCRLWTISRYSKIRLQNDSMTALSKQSPTDPMEGTRPVEGSTGECQRLNLRALAPVDRALKGLTLLDRYAKGVGHERRRGGAESINHPPTWRENTGRMHLTMMRRDERGGASSYGALAASAAA